MFGDLPLINKGATEKSLSANTFMVGPTMLRKKNQYRNRYRTSRAAIMVEHSLVLYMLFFFLFFPMINLATMGLRTFFLWFACNQAAMAGAKGTQWMYGSVETEDNVYFTGIQNQAITTCNSIVNMFSGITITSVPTAEGYGSSPNANGPILQVILTAIKHSDTTNNQASASTLTYAANQLPLAITPDPSQYVPMLKVSLTGTIAPLIPIPLPFSVAGLNKSFSVTVCSEQQIENPYALMY